MMTMKMYVRPCVYVHLCMYVCMYVCIYVCVCMFACMYVCLFVCLFICVLIYMTICKYVMYAATYNVTSVSILFVCLFVIDNFSARGWLGSITKTHDQRSDVTMYCLWGTRAGGRFTVSGGRDQHLYGLNPQGVQTDISTCCCFLGPVCWGCWWWFGCIVVLISSNEMKSMVLGCTWAGD